MIPYTRDDLARGAGEFDRAMRAQSVVPGRSGRLTPGVAVGIVAAAVKSDMPAALIDEAVGAHFASDSQLLTRILTMCEGNDWSMNLWHRMPSGKYKLCTALCQDPLPTWTYDRHRGAADF